MVRNNSNPDFGEYAVKALRDHLTNNNTTWNRLTGAIVAPLLQRCFEEYTAQQSQLTFDETQSSAYAELGGAGRARAKTPERNPLFDSLAVCTGTRDLGEVTKSAGASIGVALRQIQKVTPDVTTEEITRRAEAFRRKHKDWPLTPGSLAKYWSEFGQPKEKKKDLDPYVCPQDWRELFRNKFPEIEPPADWFDISTPLRKDILIHSLK